jgi:hypothetical protein
MAIGLRREAAIILKIDQEAIEFTIDVAASSHPLGDLIISLISVAGDLEGANHSCDWWLLSPLPKFHPCSHRAAFCARCD